VSKNQGSWLNFVKLAKQKMVGGILVLTRKEGVAEAEGAEFSGPEGFRKLPASIKVHDGLGILSAERDIVRDGRSFVDILEP